MPITITITTGMLFVFFWACRPSPLPDGGVAAAAEVPREQRGIGQ
jgi:hypothetical protein